MENKSKSFLLISEDVVISLLKWDYVLEAMQVALNSLTKHDKIIQNPRMFTPNLHLEKTGSGLLTMPACLGDPKYGGLACKLVTFFPQNKVSSTTDSLSFPSIQAHIALFCQESGQLLAFIAATEITKWRTAAVSVAATKWVQAVKRSTKSKILAILGAGEQARAHALAFMHFFTFEEIRIWNHNNWKAEALVQQLSADTKSTVKIRAIESNKECVSGADVIVTATNSPTEIVRLEWLKKGAHINAIGASRISHHTELSQLVYQSSDVFVEHFVSANVELKGLLETGIKFKGEIGSLMDEHNICMENDRITVFQSLGAAVEDCAMARLIYDLYEEQFQK